MTLPTNSATPQTTQPLGISAAFKSMESYNPKSSDDTKAAWSSYKKDYAGAMGHTTDSTTSTASMPPQVTAYGGSSAAPPAPTGPLAISAAYKSMESYNPQSKGELKTQWNSFKTNYGTEISKGTN
jgi:hypothetical protein